MSIRVLVVDDSGFFRRRVTDIINADGRMEVVGVASNGLEAIEMNESLKPDVITMDMKCRSWMALPRCVISCSGVRYLF